MLTTIQLRDGSTTSPGHDMPPCEEADVQAAQGSASNGAISATGHTHSGLPLRPSLSWCLRHAIELRAEELSWPWTAFQVHGCEDATLSTIADGHRVTIMDYALCLTAEANEDMSRISISGEYGKCGTRGTRSPTTGPTTLLYMLDNMDLATARHAFPTTKTIETREPSYEPKLEHAIKLKRLECLIFPPVELPRIITTPIRSWGRGSACTFGHHSSHISGSVRDATSEKADGEREQHSMPLMAFI
ncbi:hypothetical protein LX36DRAFT_669964 [Colletotrichum falcatum]|nr:hypothetical protein LX36DRAFT_669964 [Colletotrichum falcatum]